MKLYCSAGNNLPHVCGDGFYERENKMLCGMHFRAKYATDFSDYKQYKIDITQFETLGVQL